MDWSKARRVEENHDFVRGPNGEIVLSNKTVYDSYMSGIQMEKDREQTISSLQTDVSMLKSELGDIKSLLLTLVQNQTSHDN